MYLNQTQLGQLFGGTSHDVGRWLEAIGLRSGGSPTQKAFVGGYVSSAGLQYGYRWHRDKTVAALEQGGHKQVPQKSSARITGPFSTIESSPNTFQVLGGNGTVSIWVIGRENADLVAKLLNLAYKHGKFQ